MEGLNAPNGEILPVEEHIVTDDVDNLLANSMSNKLQEFSGQPDQSKPWSIFRVPEYIRNKNKALYEPQIIAIGPYHCRAKSLEPMEEQKWRYLHELLNQGDVVCSLLDLVTKVRSLEADARSAYKESVSLTSNEFVEMMVLDGCFIIHFLRLDNSDKMDSGMSIKSSDLLLLENQIPFFIIQNLYSVIYQESPLPGEEYFSLISSTNTEIQLYKLFAKFMFNAANYENLNPPIVCPVHLVHLYYQWFLQRQAPRRTRKLSRSSIKSSCWKIWCYRKWIQEQQRIMDRTARFTDVDPVRLTTRAPIKVIPTATALTEAGVKFKRRTSSRDLFHVTFHKGVMEISSVILDNTRKRLFLNLIALEQSAARWEKDLTSFAKLMDMLIDTPKDVAILERCGILHNLLASSGEAAHFFNQICACATVDYNSHYLAEVIQDVRQYCDSPWHKHRARLMREYFNNPWSIISLIAGIMLLILSFLQVYYTAKPPKYS